jgi:hypothetical protein
MSMPMDSLDISKLTWISRLLARRLCIETDEYASETLLVVSQSISLKLEILSCFIHLTHGAANVLGVDLPLPSQSACTFILSYVIS